MRNAQQVQNLVTTAVKTFGGLHFAFNNAGILPAAALLADVDEAAFDQVVAVDIKGVFLAMKYEIRQMLGTGGGAIVNNAFDRRNDRGSGDQRVRGGETRGDWIVESGRDRVRESGNPHQRAGAWIGGDWHDKALVRGRQYSVETIGQHTDWSRCVA